MKKILPKGNKLKPKTTTKVEHDVPVRFAQLGWDAERFFGGARLWDGKTWLGRLPLGVTQKRKKNWLSKNLEWRQLKNSFR